TAVIQDENYSLQEILTDQSLRFNATDSLVNTSSYWVRIVIADQNVQQDFYLTIYPNFDTKLYRFDKTSKQWISQRSTVGDRKLRLGQYFYEKQSNEVDTLYAWINLR